VFDTFRQNIGVADFFISRLSLTDFAASKACLDSFMWRFGKCIILFLLIEGLVPCDTYVRLFVGWL
jgi:hypothetical protein